MNTTEQLLNVSRETLDRLEAYLALLEKWNKSINLVAKSTIQDAWNRHFLDSIQVFNLADKNTGYWLDIGSGGGFPGLPCAIVAAEKAPQIQFGLVESDQRKCAFLRAAQREVGLSLDIFNHRVERLEPVQADIMSARALASLNDLLGFTHRHMKPSGTALFPKGANWRQEIEDARKNWSFTYEPHQSKTESQAVILEINGVERV